ncbi:hypothetical protein BpHYR1_037676 [Brachionus plicatilis]|uniref:Uncharacterized protein n=1 Tax=Brachionus plicatilis TaxID=10195 RepID=A0A3M7QVX7_BRAPC|nr:hypothetical protein BpHYR1_037676 [Brachionus plicatilis]
MFWLISRIQLSFLLEGLTLTAFDASFVVIRVFFTTYQTLTCWAEAKSGRSERGQNKAATLAVRQNQRAQY